MSVGDLKNNLRKLQSELRGVKYEVDIDLQRISKGVVGAFLPIYHHLFLEYSHAIAAEISNMNIEMSGKTDLRFVEAMYKVLRELFSYKPPITKEQLFANGFAERKVIMCTEVIRLVRARHIAKTPKSTKSKPGTTGQAAKLGPRAVSTAIDSTAVKEGNSAIDAAAKLPPRPPARGTSDALSIQVVNEIRRSVETSITPVAQPITDHPHPCLLHTEQALSTEPTYVAADSPMAEAQANPITVETKVIREDGAGQKRAAQVAWQDMKAVVVNVGEQKTKEKSSYNPSRYGTVQDDDDVLEEEPLSHVTTHPRPIDIIPKTPARTRLVAPPVSQTTADGEDLPPEVIDTLHKMEKSMTECCTRIRSLESRLGVVEGLLSLQQEHNREQDKNRISPLTPEQLETLLARMTLVENKVSLVEAQQKSQKDAVLRSATNGGIERNAAQKCLPISTTPAPKLPFSPIVAAPVTQTSAACSQHADSSYTELEMFNSGPTPEQPVSEPPAPVVHGYSERWSSTPTELDEPLKENALNNNNTSDGKPISSQAARIHNILKNTESMLNVQVVTPQRLATN